MIRINFNKKILIILVVVLFCLVGFFVYQNQQKNDANKTDLISGKENSSGQVVYIINKGEGQPEEYQIEISQTETAFSLLQKLAELEDFEIGFTNYDFGVFVESIDGLKNGQNNQYWQYWVNDKLAEVAADKKEVEIGDRVEWKFEVPPEF